MKVDVVVEGNVCVLVPYRKHHVATYHEWMKDPLLLEQTASEPLTLEKEYEMQKSWEVDQDKLTFIILKKNEEQEGLNSHENYTKYMVGDVNLFFNDPEDKHAAEIEVMVAVTEARRGGIGLCAVTLMMKYAHKKLNLTRFVAKIGDGNHASKALFTQKLGYKQVSHCDVFNETTLEYNLSDDGNLEKLENKICNFKERPDSNSDK
mmetsp:Transcript_10193/g.13267  ORF Transcript_10193/g.13267 Transcript_10193/m.13267 type:complete len:206 (-) Transcript_10193:1364-1981(-)